MEKSVELEKSIELSELIREHFHCNKVDIRTYSPLALAHIGDAVYEVIVRTIVVEQANRSAAALHKQTVQYVNAAAQASMIEALLPLLSETEQAVYKRGKNAKSATSSKNASLRDYHRATGFEALIGYLYLDGQTKRILELVKQGMELTGQS